MISVFYTTGPIFIKNAVKIVGTSKKFKNMNAPNAGVTAEKHILNETMK